MSTTPSPLVQCYQNIAAISANMLVQAKEGAWSEVIKLSQQYMQAVECLRQHDHLSQSDREQRRELLNNILNDDAEIRLLASPELQRLNALLGNLKRQQNVLHTYGSIDVTHA